MATIKQNTSINSFISQNLKSLFFIVIFLTLLLVGGKMFGASPFSDDFDSYNVGNLIPQGDWATTTALDISPLITTSTYSSWPNSLWWTSENYGAIKEGDHKITGDWSFRAKINSDAGVHGESIGISMTGNVYSNDATVLTFSCVSNDCETTGLVKVDVCGVELGQIPIDQWTNFQVEWDSSLNEARWKMDFEDWSDWEQCYTNTFPYIQGFAPKRSGQTGKLQANLDSISATCGVGNCNLCQEYNSCTDNGCSWYYSIYLQNYSCVEPVVPDPEECGAFYKCQYCGDLTTCGEQLNCEWTDKGFGDQCYMAEPTIPPSQVDWEIPDLDDCSSLPALDTLVCEIKNLMIGAFMPSTTTTEALYQTVSAFKDKFPFNYVASLDNFFTSIAEDLETPRAIPIEILGTTSTVSFVFWDATTTIGGAEETLKNVLIDFTTFIILLGWFAWFISLIKRFF